MKNLKFIFLTTIIFILLNLFSSCKKGKCFNSTGEIIKKERKTNDFTKINLYGVFDVYLKSGNSNRIEIEIGENLINNVETNVENNILTITDNNNCNFIKGYKKKKLHITVDTITQITIFDGAKLYTIDTLKTSYMYILFKSEIGYSDLTVDCDVFKFSVWFASGDYYLHGKAENFVVNAHHLAFIYAQDFESKFCIAHNNSFGDIYVNSNNILYTKITNEGNIYYSGNPEKIIVEDESGNGKLIKINNINN